MLSCGEGGSTGAEVINQVNANTSDIEAINAVADVYETESNTDILDIPDTYTNINNLVIPNLPAGQYLVGVSFTYHLSVANKRIDYKWSLNGVIEEFNDSPKDAISNVARCYVFPFTQATDGSFSISVDIKKEDNSGTLDVAFANVWADKKKELTP